MALNYLASISRYVPELLSVVIMVGLIFIEACYDREEKKKPFFYLAAFFGLAFVFVNLAADLSKPATMIFTGSMTIDPFSTLSKMLMVLGTMGAIYLSKESKDIYDNLKSEFAIMAVGVMIGGMILASANNLLMVYIGIETLSILSYALASFKKNEERSSEAGLKYSLYGGISSGIMLFGMSHIFGVFGSIQFTDIIAGLNGLSTAQLAVLLPSFIMFFAGIGYKIACVPFHMWAPDVYEGSPLPVTTFFSIVPKVAGLAVLLRVTMTFFGQEGALQVTWVGALSVISALTMTVGNVSAIGQRSVKRMLAYSSISHAGMMMMGVVVINELGTRSILFYAITYLFMTLVAFYVTSFVADKYGNDHFERFSGLIKRYPLMAIMMTVVMFSLAGMPPLSGFVAKFNILGALLSEKHYMLALIAVLNSVVSLYYYMKIIRLMVLKDVESMEPIIGVGVMNQSVILVLTVPVLALGLFWSGIMRLTEGASIFLGP